MAVRISDALRAAAAEAEARADALAEALRGIVTFKPREVCLDEFAFKRVVNTYREMARAALAQHTKEEKNDD